MCCVQAPPVHPLYPEPQPRGKGRYILDPSTYTTHLPRKFHNVDYSAAITDRAEVVVVHSDGALTVEAKDHFFGYSSPFASINGNGRSHLEDRETLRKTAVLGLSRRWSFLPFTKEQEKSCAPLKIDLRSLAVKKMKTKL